MDVLYSLKMLVYFQQATQCYVPEGKSHHNHLSEDLKSCEFAVAVQFVSIKFIISSYSRNVEFGIHIINFVIFVKGKIS